MAHGQSAILDLDSRKCGYILLIVILVVIASGQHLITVEALTSNATIVVFLCGIYA